RTRLTETAARAVTVVRQAFSRRFCLRALPRTLIIGISVDWKWQKHRPRVWTMPIVFPCPTCSAQLTLTDAASGRRGECPHCKGEMVVRRPTAPPLATPVLPSPPAPSLHVAAAPQAFPPAPPVPWPQQPQPFPQPLPGNHRPHRGVAIATLGGLGVLFSVGS